MWWCFSLSLSKCFRLSSVFRSLYGLARVFALILFGVTKLPESVGLRFLPSLGNFQLLHFQVIFSHSFLSPSGTQAAQMPGLVLSSHTSQSSVPLFSLSSLCCSDRVISNVLPSVLWVLPLFHGFCCWTHPFFMSGITYFSSEVSAHFFFICVRVFAENFFSFLHWCFGFPSGLKHFSNGRWKHFRRSPLTPVR